MPSLARRKNRCYLQLSWPCQRHLDAHILGKRKTYWDKGVGRSTSEGVGKGRGMLGRKAFCYWNNLLQDEERVGTSSESPRLSEE